MQKCLLVLFLAQLLIIKGLCQSGINGAVRTKDSLKIPFATVTLYSDSVALQNVVCDSNGHFTLAVPQPAPAHMFLRAYYRNLISDSVVVSAHTGWVSVIINDPAQVLSAVTIEADVSRITRQGDRFVFVPSKALTRGSDAWDVLRHVPMIKVEDQADAFSIINKSGTVIYVNNRKSDIPKDMIVQLLRSMPADNIISIEVITNPGSEYASNITGGIVNINLRRGFTEGWQGSLTVLSEQSKYNTSMLNGGVTYRKGNVAVNLVPFINSSFNYYRSDNVLTGIDDRVTSMHTEYHRTYLVLGGGVNVDYQPSKRSFFGFKYWLTNVSGKPDMITHTTIKAPGHPDSLTTSYYGGNDKYLYNFGNVNFQYNLDSVGKDYLVVNVDFNRFNQDRTLEGAFDLIEGGGQPVKPLGQYRNMLPQRFRNLSEAIDFKKTLSSNTGLSLGVQFSHTKVSNDLRYYDRDQNGYSLNETLSRDYQYREAYQAVYVSVNRKFSSKLSSSAALRFERTDYESSASKAGLSFDSTYYNLYPSLSVNYSPSQKQQFGYSLSRKIIRPNIEELYPGRIYRSNDFFTENNPFLQPTLLFVNELSWLFKRRYSLSLTWSGTRNSSARFVIPVMEDNTTRYNETLINYGRIRQLSVVFNTSFYFLKGRWQLYVTPWYNHVIYSGNIASKAERVVNNDVNIIADNYFQLSKKKNLAAFLTFQYNGPSRTISAERVNALSSIMIQFRKTIRNFTFSLIASDVYHGKSETESNLFLNPLLIRNHVNRFAYTRAIQFRIRYTFGNSHLKATKNRTTANEEIRGRAN